LALSLLHRSVVPSKRPNLGPCSTTHHVPCVHGNSVWCGDGGGWGGVGYKVPLSLVDLSGGSGRCHPGETGRQRPNAHLGTRRLLCGDGGVVMVVVVHMAPPKRSIGRASSSVCVCVCVCLCVCVCVCVCLCVCVLPKRCAVCCGALFLGRHGRCHPAAALGTGGVPKP
jgi:hypothetical protein